MKHALLILSFSFTLNAYSQSDTTRTGEKIFQLGEAPLTGIKNLAGITVTSSSRLEKLNQVDVTFPCQPIRYKTCPMDQINLLH